MTRALDTARLIASCLVVIALTCRVLSLDAAFAFLLPLMRG